MNSGASNISSPAVHFPVHLENALNLVEFILNEALCHIIVNKCEHLHCEVACIVTTIDTYGSCWNTRWQLNDGKKRIVWNTTAARTVSYTHLTLPTMMSV